MRTLNCQRTRIKGGDIMKAEDIKVGHWYMIDEQPFLTGTKGKCVDVVGGKYAVLKFYWGGLTRSNQAIKISNIVGECRRPGWFSNF